MVKKYKLKTKPIQIKLNPETVYFDGHAYNHKYDQKRLTGGLMRVFDCMQDGIWRTFTEIYELTGGNIPENSISAHLRSLRKYRFGEHTVLRRKRDSHYRGLFEYKLIVNINWIHYKLEKGEI